MISRPGSAMFLCVLLLWSGGAASAPLYFEYTAVVNGSNVTGAPDGSILTGRFHYDPSASLQFGPTYYPHTGSATLSARGEGGFFLSRDIRIVNVAPGASWGGDYDSVTLQSYISEEPNGWNMVLDFLEPLANDWLEGDGSLPDAYPLNPDNAYLSLYFTDEYEWVRVVDATILTVAVSQVPLPAAAWLFLSALAGLAGLRRYHLTPGGGS